MFFAKLHFFFVVTLISVTSVASADQQPPLEKLPEGGTRAIEAESLAPEKLNVNNGGTLATHSIRKQATEDGASSIKVDITGQPQNTWDISVNRVTTTPVKKGDALVASFWVRGNAKSGQGGGVTEFVFEKAGAPYTLSLIHI